MAPGAAANELAPSSASATLQTVVGTAPLAYESPVAVPVMVRTGAVLDGAGAVTFTVNAAGARLKVPPVSLLTCVAVMLADPAPTGVMVSRCVSPHEVNVVVAGETVATAGVLDTRFNFRVVDPVRLQPFFPSPLVVSTASTVLPLAPPTFRGMTSAVESMVPSRLL